MGRQTSQTWASSCLQAYYQRALEDHRVIENALHREVLCLGKVLPKVSLKVQPIDLGIVVWHKDLIKRGQKQLSHSSKIFRNNGRLLPLPSGIS